jgi:hypothetical protein
MENILSVMEIVERICTKQPENEYDCRGKYLFPEARELLDIYGVKKDVTITEVPLAWNNQVVHRGLNKDTIKQS